MLFLILYFKTFIAKCTLTVLLIVGTADFGLIFFICIFSIVGIDDFTGEAALEQILGVLIATGLGVKLN